MNAKKSERHHHHTHHTSERKKMCDSSNGCLGVVLTTHGCGHVKMVKSLLQSLVSVSKPLTFETLIVLCDNASSENGEPLKVVCREVLGDDCFETRPIFQQIFCLNM